MIKWKWEHDTNRLSQVTSTTKREHNLFRSQQAAKSQTRLFVSPPETEELETQPLQENKKISKRNKL